jgi:hypothetical protein
MTSHIVEEVRRVEGPAEITLGDRTVSVPEGATFVGWSNGAWRVESESGDEAGSTTVVSSGTHDPEALKAALAEGGAEAEPEGGEPAEDEPAEEEPEPAGEPGPEEGAAEEEPGSA